MSKISQKGVFFMKNTFKWFGIIALIAIIGFTVVACGDDSSTSDSLKTLSGTITISPSTSVTTGTLLTATYLGSETVTYQWKKNETAISAATNKTYTPPTAGSYTVTVSMTGYASKTSAAVTVTGEDLPALTGTVTITGSTVTAQLLTANTNSLNGTGTYSYEWKRGTTQTAVNAVIAGANQSTYNLTAAEKGMYITVTVTCSSNTGSKTSTAVGPVTEPAPETSVPGASLAEKLQWLTSNAESDGNYLVELTTAYEAISPTLSYTGRNNIAIRLKGVGTSPRNVGGSFTVGNGVTLILDSNITLTGSYGSVVNVNSGGTLIMNQGTKITGGNSDYGGGVYVDNEGTFTMHGGEISGNTGNYSAGGVYVRSGGTFTMHGGEISGNTNKSSDISRGGGGVYVASGSVSGQGTFTMHGGEISGNTAKNSGGGGYSFGTFRIVTGTIYGSNAGALSNNARNFAAFGGDINYGIFSGTTWNSNGNLPYSSNTIRVVNGELQ
jgi:hypothetical protein